MKRVAFYCVILGLISVLPGCLTTRNFNKTNEVLPAPEVFNKKVIAILPVKASSSVTTDSSAPLKKALNMKLVKVFKDKFPNARIITSSESVEALNDSGKLNVLEKLITSYDNTGAFDKKTISTLCSILKCDYLVLPKLKVEQMDMIFVAKGFSSSLEVQILDKKKSEPLWTGIGDFKRGGIYGAGTTENDEAANELVTLVFENQTQQ